MLVLEEALQPAIAVEASKLAVVIRVLDECILNECIS
jgi:hypothetical protein